MKRKGISFTTKYTAIVCVLLIVAVTAVSAVLMIESNLSMKSLLRRHMISVADTAAASVDGDFLGRMTADDVGSDEYNRIVSTLLLIKDAQKDSDIKYIYTVKRAGDHFVFTVDPDPDNPADFEEDVVKTDGQDLAWSGTSATDKEQYEDEWGCYYSAWSPIRDSKGEIVGLVGMDFVADWYDGQVASHTRVVLIIGLLALAGGLLIMFMLTAQLRRKFMMLSSEMSILSEYVMELSEEIKDHSTKTGYVPEALIDAAGHDTIEQLNHKIRDMRSKLREYLDYIHAQAYTDTMTGVANKSSYLAKKDEINKQINNGTASFAVAVFDINDLKGTNDNYGHECGDRIITDSAAIIGRVFPFDSLYRIGGDEFIAILFGMSEEELNAKFAELDEVVEHFNEHEKDYAMTLSFSRGGSVYQPGVDAAFKETFKRADQAMYDNKKEHYMKFDRRGSR